MTDKPSNTTIPFPTLLASVDPGVATIQEYVDQFSQESETLIRQRFAAMWVIVFSAEWELNYRKLWPQRTVAETLMCVPR